MTHARCAILAFSAAILLSACSGIEEKRQAYRQSESIAPLKVPPHLNRPQGQQVLMVPEVNKADLGDQPFDVSPPAAPPLDDESIQANPIPASPIPAGPTKGHAH